MQKLKTELRFNKVVNRWIHVPINTREQRAALEHARDLRQRAVLRCNQVKRSSSE